MYDWLTLRIDLADLPKWVDLKALVELSDVIERYNPVTGEMVYQTSAWDSIRSDSHGLSFRVGTELAIQGSPARCWRNGCNVWGSRSIIQCARLMVALFTRVTGVRLPDPMRCEGWRVSRVDITQNYDLGSLANVRTALEYLRGLQGGRYRVSQTAGDTVYWSQRSRRRSGKAYAKGPHIAYQIKKGNTTALYSDAELEYLNRLIRLELKLGSQFWSDFYKEGGNWRYIDWEYMSGVHAAFFGPMIGSDKIGVDMGVELLDKIRDAAVQLGHKETAGDRAHCTFQMIKSMGYEHAREIIARPTWYRHLSILRQAGLGDLDIAQATVTPLRRTITMRSVSSWSDLLAA